MPIDLNIRRAGTWMTALVWLGLAICLYSIASDYHQQWDLRVYYTAARALVEGKTPYVPIYPHPWDRTDVFFYNYPPLTLYLFLWSTAFSLPVAKVIWLGIKLVGLACLVRLWHKSFERLAVSWPILLFLVLGFSATLLRDFAAGNISTLEQLGLWLGFGLLLRGRLYAAALVLACVSQFKFLPVAFLGLIPLVNPREGWKPFAVGCVVFLGLLALNPLAFPGLTHDYLAHFNDAKMRLDDRGVTNPSSLSMFRDLMDASSYTSNLPENVAAGTRIYALYLVALLLILIRAAWNHRTALRNADPKLLVYFACALFMLVAPRLKDYSYILMLIPALFVIRDLERRGRRLDYLLLGVALMAWGQPQQNYVPGLQVFIYLLQAYLPLVLSAGIMVYVLRTILLAQEEALPEARPAPSPQRLDVGL